MTSLLVKMAEQTTLAPPPLPEPLHWLIVMLKVEAVVPVAVQARPTSVPPLAEPLHWVIAALVADCNGMHPVVRPPPEPTHWSTVAAASSKLTPLKLS